MLIKNLFRYWTYQVFSPGTVLREKYESFKALLEYDKSAHEFMATLEEIYYSHKKCDFQAVVKNYGHFARSVSGMVEELLKMCPSDHWSLRDYYKKFDFYIRFMLAPPEFEFSPPFTIGLEEISSHGEAIAGKKAFSLSRLNKELRLPVPDGFVITTNAFHYFLEFNDLRAPIDEKLAHLDIACAASLEQTAFDIEQLILNATLPEDIGVAVTDAINALACSCQENSRFALRSSAVKEDGKASFAGQYETLLNVEKKSVSNGYKRVIASKYSARALFYRISHGILDSQAPMAVLVLEMVDAMASGVIYTADIEEPQADNLFIHSIWGQGELLVDGGVSPDVIRVSKKNPSNILSRKIAAKPKQTVLTAGIKTRTIDTDHHQKNHLSLDDPSVQILAGWGRAIDAHYGEPQDIEWCRDRSGKLFVLQSRPLHLHPARAQIAMEKTETIENPVVCSGGESVCPGVGAGAVFRLEQLSQIPEIPHGAVLVVRHALPQLVTAIDRVNAVIIGTGSKASHFSSIAREFGVPAIVNACGRFDDLVQDSLVTVDADSGIVYEGIAKPLREAVTPKEDFFKESEFMVKLRFVIDFSSKLKLTDPGSDFFVPEACRSLHDIIRFAHEMAVKEMFSMGDRRGGRKKGAKKLLSGLPMLFYLLDVGGGIKVGPENESALRPEDIASIPMKALLKGLSDPGICWSETTHFDWEAYDRVVMAGGIISADSPMFGSYAVLAKEYLNVNLRFGYHFVILDTICSPVKEDNYILFRFAGGGGSAAGRCLRASFVKGVLTRLGFMVDVKSDLVDAEFKHGSLEMIEEKLDMTGRLLGATKLLDMYIKEDLDARSMIDEFMNGRYDFRPAVPECL